MAPVLEQWRTWDKQGFADRGLEASETAAQHDRMRTCPSNRNAVELQIPEMTDYRVGTSPRSGAPSGGTFGQADELWGE